MQPIRFNREKPISPKSEEDVKNVKELLTQIDTREFRGWWDGEKEGRSHMVNDAIEEILLAEENGWTKQTYVDKRQGQLFGKSDFRKGRVAVEVQFDSNVINDLAKFQTLYEGGEIDCCILVLAMPAFRKHIGRDMDLQEFSRQIESIGGLDNLSLSEGPTIPHRFEVPFFLFGISTPEIEKTPSKKRKVSKLLEKQRAEGPPPPLPQAYRTQTSLQVIQPPLFYNLPTHSTALPARIQEILLEVQLLIEQVDTQLCHNDRDEINEALKEIFEKYGWEAEKRVDEAIIEYEKSIDKKGRSDEPFDEHKVDFYKDRVAAIEVQFGQRIGFDLSKMQRLFTNKAIDCGIEVLVTPALAKDIHATVNIDTFFFYLRTLGLGQPEIPHVFTLPLVVFSISTQEVQDRNSEDGSYLFGILGDGEIIVNDTTGKPLGEIPGTSQDEMSSPPMYIPAKTVQTTQARQTAVPPAPSLANTSPPRKSAVTSKVVLSVTLAILLILGSLGLYAFNAHQTAINNANATATTQANNTATAQAAQATDQASTATAQAIDQANTATAQAIQAATQVAYQATADAQAQATANAAATATAIASNPYPPYTGSLAINDPLSDNSQGYQWDESPTCIFTNGAYQVSTSADAVSTCTAQATNFTSSFVYQVDITITEGCGGITFFSQGDNFNYTMFEVCQDGSSDISVCEGNSASFDCSSGGNIPPNSAIQTGSGQTNTLAVVYANNSLSFYVNQQLLQTAGSGMVNVTGGKIGVLASIPSTGGYGQVTCSNVKVWTL